MAIGLNAAIRPSRLAEMTLPTSGIRVGLSALAGKHGIQVAISPSGGAGSPKIRSDLTPLANALIVRFETCGMAAAA